MRHVDAGGPKVAADGHKGVDFGGPCVGANAVVRQDQGRRSGFQPVPESIGTVTGQQFAFDRAWGTVRQNLCKRPGRHPIVDRLTVAFGSADVGPVVSGRNECLDPPSFGDQGPIGIDTAVKRVRWDEVENIRIENLDAREGQQPTVRGMCACAWFAEARHKVVRIDRNRVELRCVVQNQCHRLRVLPVESIHRSQIDVGHDVAVDDHKGLIVPEIRNVLHRTAGTADHRFKACLHRYRVPASGHERFDLIMQVVGVDDDGAAAGRNELPDHQIQNRLIGDREQRFRSETGVGKQPGAKTGGKDHGFHRMFARCAAATCSSHFLLRRRESVIAGG